MTPLRGKLALITGGSRGIGLAIAKAFAARGASTVLVARNPAGLANAVTAVQAAYIPPPPPSTGSSSTSEQSEGENDNDLPFYTGVSGDVAQASTWEDLASKLKRGEIGRRVNPCGSPGFLPDTVDVLVNCAGIAQFKGHLTVQPEEIANILDTNLRSAAFGCKYIGRLIPPTKVKSQRGSRSIINVSSAMALGGGYGAAVYAASKAGLLGLTSALALEFAVRGVRVNALLPGYIATDMTAEMTKSRANNVIPMARLGTVEEMADAAVFLAQNAYANNCVLTIDGGLSAAFGTLDQRVQRHDNYGRKEPDE